MDALAQGFADARAVPRVKGFAVGRTLFDAPSRAWLAGTLDDQGLVDTAARQYAALVDAALQQSQSSWMMNWQPV